MPDAANLDRVIARKRGRTGLFVGFHQRADAGKNAEHIGSRRALREVVARRFEDEVDLLTRRVRLQHRLRNSRVGGAYQRVAVPRDGEHHAPIARVRHHDRSITGQKLPRQHDVHTLARRDDRLRCPIVHPAQLIAKRAGCVDDRAGAKRVRRAAFLVAKAEAVDETAAVFRE